MILRFNESQSFFTAKDIIDNIKDICSNLSDELIEFHLEPDNDIKVKMLGIYLNGGIKRTKFEVNIRVKKLNEEQTKELFLTIQQLQNYCQSEGLKQSYELEYEKTFPKRYGRVSEATNIVKSETFDKSMMNKINYWPIAPALYTARRHREEANLCRRIIIKFDR
jgi:hypothetical protein